MYIKSVFTVVSIAIIVSVSACGKRESYEEESAADSTASESNLNGTENDKSTNFPKESAIIRTADLKFKVKNVQKVSEQIEDLVAQNKGFISYSNHNVDINRQETTQISADSSIERTYFNESNSITIKVPNKSLDITLRQLASMVEFLNSKTIKAEDVYLELLSNQLKIKRNSSFQNNVSTSNPKSVNSLLKVAEVEDIKLEKQTNADDALINNLSLNQQIAFSTITLEIYQRDAFKDSKVAFDKVIKPYEEPFYLQFWNSLNYGLIILENIVLAITKLWVLILIAIAGLWIYKKQIQNK